MAKKKSVWFEWLDVYPGNCPQVVGNIASIKCNFQSLVPLLKQTSLPKPKFLQAPKGLKKLFVPEKLLKAKKENLAPKKLLEKKKKKTPPCNSKRFVATASVGFLIKTAGLERRQLPRAVPRRREELRRLLRRLRRLRLKSISARGPAVCVALQVG